MRKLRSILALMFFALAGSAMGQTAVTKPEAVATPSEDLVAGLNSKNERYRIGFQDLLDIQVFGQPKLAQRVPVSSNGTIVLFRLERPVVAVCKTERELATDIENAYKEKYLKDPKVQVVVADQKSQSVAVIGAVDKPQVFYLNRRYHLLEMLAMAGGPNKESGTRMLVARTGSSTNCRDKGDESNGDQISVMGFKVRDVQEGRETLWVQPGDVISVLDADIIYVYGNVHKQGAVKVREPITLTQAIVSAEGFKSAAKKDKVRVLRQVQGKADREELTFDMDEIDKGKVKDPYLEPNDIVAVSQDTKKAILLGVVDAIKTSVPNAIFRLP